jgi:hypothetical protein
MDWGGGSDEDLPIGNVPPLWFQIAIACWMAFAVVGTLKFAELMFRALVLGA